MFQNIVLYVLGVFFTAVFLISGIIINILQALIYLALYNRNRTLYRKINGYLIYASWAQVLSMFEWWSNSSCNLHGDEESLRWFGKEHGIVIMNHKYDVDWLICWFVCDKLRILGNTKTCAKKSLRYIPVIGWGWIFAEMIFLERSWEKDKLVLGQKLDKLVDYKTPVLVLYFCEGTRFTPEKHKASMEFAEARNLPQLKYHLCPRTSGFNFSATYLKDKFPAVYDIQLVFPEGPMKPTFSNMLRGYSFVGDMHVRRIPMSEVPTDSDEATSKWLHQLYQEKDKLTDDYFKFNRLPGKCIKLKRSYRSLLVSIFWIIVVGIPSLRLLFQLLTTGNFWITSITVSVLILLFSLMYLMVRVTKSSKGSSYGKDASPAKSSNGSFKCDNPSEEVSKSKNTMHEGDIRERVTISQSHEQTS